MTLIFLGLGSNQGDSVSILRSAYADLGRILREPRISSLYVSKARYVTDQPDFVNAVVSGLTELDPRGLLGAIHEIEAAHGRDRSRERSKGPRSLDIDILLHGDAVLDEADLAIPHSGLGERKFALLPLVELSPDLRDPRSGKPYAELLAGLPAQGIYLLGPPHYDRLYT